MKRINLVNVIELNFGVVSDIAHFTNPEDAEKCFREWMDENVPVDELKKLDINDVLDDGFYETGDMGIYIVHSTLNL